MDVLTEGEGWLWLLGTVFGTLCLGGAIVYGIMMNRTRRTTPEIEQVREAATERQYKSPDGQEL